MVRKAPPELHGTEIYSVGMGQGNLEGGFGLDYFVRGAPRTFGADIMFKF